MTNSYYNPTGVPAENSEGLSADIRNELILIRDGFQKLPTPEGHPDLPVFVNAGGTALETKTVADALTAMSGAPLASPALTGNPTAPTPAQFDNDTSIATTAFVNTAGLHWQPLAGVGISVNTALTLAQSGRWFQINAGGLTVTLPDVATTTAGITTYTFVASNAFTLAGNGANEVHTATASGNTLSVLAGETLVVVSHGTRWYVALSGFGSASMALKANIVSPSFTGTPVSVTPARLSNDTKIATMAALVAHGLHMPSSGVGIVANTTLTIANSGKWYEIQNPGLTVTLPAIASEIAGITYTFKALFSFTLKGNGAEIVRSGAGASNTYDCYGGQTLTVVSNGAGNFWYVIFDGFGAGSFEASTHTQELPGGLIEKRGTFVSHAVGRTQVAVSFATPFPTLISNIQLTPESTSGSEMIVWFDTPTVNGFNARCTAPSTTIHYLVKGR